LENIALLLEVCSAHLEKLQLALEISDGDDQWNRFAALFESIRRVKHHIGVVHKPGIDVPLELYLGVVDEPRSWQWQRRPAQWTRYRVRDADSPNLKLRVLDTEWVRTLQMIDPWKGKQIRIPAGSAPSKPDSLRRYGPTQKPRQHRYRAGLDALLYQQDSLRQHSQELSKTVEVERRRMFNTQAMQTELERICARSSLLRIRP
jgi:hypothetical protein